MNHLSPSRHRPLGVLEGLTLAQVGVFFAGTTWAFGGNAYAVRPYLAAWGGLAPLLIIAALAAKETRRELSLRRLAWLLPLLLFNLLVLASSLTPGLRAIELGGDFYYAPLAIPAWRPSSALPGRGIAALLLFDGIYLSCFNLAWIVHRRRALRGLLLFAAGNALALAIFGTVQKLSGATGLFFGLVPSPQIYFFASFIYHNHWGAFTVLMTTACLGLVWHYGLRHPRGRDLFHTPAFGGLVAVLFLAATAPLSTSRSCSAMVLLVLGGAFAHWLARLVRQRRQYKESVALPLAATLAAGAIALAGIWLLANETIVLRMAKTREQLADIRARGSIGSRAILYHDTWRMAQDRPWFGWGMASYQKVFEFYNSQTPGPVDHLPVYYRNAHSDWLESLAEHGFVGTALLGLCGLVPLAGFAKRPGRGPLPAYLLAGCGLILAYAWIEFPFGNIAVVLTWWMCFFSAVRYAQLQHAGARSPKPDPGPA